MKLIQTIIRRSSFSRRQFQIHSTSSRPFSAMPLPDYGHNQGDDLPHQNANFTDIYKKLVKSDTRSSPSFKFTASLDGLNDSSFESSSTTDHMDIRLKNAATAAATFFDFDPEEVTGDNYSFRPDVNFQTGGTYDTEDLNLLKPGVRKPAKRREFETTTQEVLSKADFRNVRFLAQFLTEAGVIIQRSKTGISAKAQRKVAREIKTARAFGLMPFTTMGTKHFKFGHTMEDNDLDFGYEPSYEHSFVDDDKEE